MKRLVLIVALMVSIPVFAKQSADWYGKYIFNDSGENVTHTRSYVATHSLDVTQEGGNIVATYRMTFNSDPYEAERWFGHESGNALTFTYDHCLLEIEKHEDSSLQAKESSGPKRKRKVTCTESQKQGTVMLKLVRVNAKNGGTILKTYWGELKPLDISRTKSGGIYFEKIKE